MIFKEKSDFNRRFSKGTVFQEFLPYQKIRFEKSVFTGQAVKSEISIFRG